MFVKPARGEPPRDEHEVEADDAGLVGDCHAHPLGPRQVLIVREETLEQLRVAPWQVRANIATRGLPGDELTSGAVLHIGDSARIRVTHECEVCRVLRRYVPTAAFRRLPGRRGWLGVVLSPGSIGLGDSVTIGRGDYPAVPDAIPDRLAWVVARVPAGRVVSYETLLRLVGGSRPYFRVLPRYLKRADAAGLPAHRVVTSAGMLTGHIDEQRQRLAAEGVDADSAGRVRNARRYWDGRHLYKRRS